MHVAPHSITTGTHTTGTELTAGYLRQPWLFLTQKVYRQRPNLQQEPQDQPIAADRTEQRPYRPLQYPPPKEWTAAGTNFKTAQEAVVVRPPRGVLTTFQANPSFSMPRITQ